jgi:hypothetical protein
MLGVEERVGSVGSDFLEERDEDVELMSWC